MAFPPAGITLNLPPCLVIVGRRRRLHRYVYMLVVRVAAAVVAPSPGSAPSDRGGVRDTAVPDHVLHASVAAG